MGEIVRAEVNYGSIEVRLRADQAASRIRGYMGKAVLNLAEIGRELSEMKKVLPHGQFEPWLENVVGISVDTAYRYRRLSEYIQDHPEIVRMSVDAALKYPRLDPPLRERILEKEAFTWTAFSREVEDYECEQWKAGMDRHLLQGCGQGEPCDPDKWTGEVFEWTREAMGSDNNAEARAAKEYYEAHREEWARLSDRSPRELDAEIGYKPEKQGGQHATLGGNDDGLWIARRLPDGSAEWVKPVDEIIKLWPGGHALVHVVTNGPGSSAWWAAMVEAAKSRGLLLRTPEDLAQEVNCLYGGEVL